MGDFTGFTFGEWQSSNPTSGEVTVLRVSGGDRYEEQLHPEIKDITAEVPGMDGEYYFGSNYGPKTIDIEIAFDHLTEEQFRRLRQVFGTRKVKELIFDERPYKKYMAKIESPVELSYVCFDEPKRHLSSTTTNGVRRDRENDQEYVPGGEVTDNINVPAGETVTYTLTHIPNGDITIEPEVEYTHEEGTYVYSFSNEGEESITITLTYTYNATPFEAAWEQVTPWVYDEGTQRIYKGEGKISFICYFPFAKSVFKQLPFTYQLTKDENIIEGKKYFILENTTYSVVTEPNVADIEEYYERVVSGESEAWAISSGILSIDEYEANNIDKYDNETSTINIYNPGDMNTGFRLYLPKQVAQSGISLLYKADGIHETASLIINSITFKNNLEIGVLIDTTNEIIAGVSQVTIDSIFTTSGNIYNEYVGAGYFFKFEPNFDKEVFSTLEISGGDNIEVFYDYLYF